MSRDDEILKAARTFNRASQSVVNCSCAFILIVLLTLGGIGYGVYSWVQHINRLHDERIQQRNEFGAQGKDPEFPQVHKSQAPKAP